MGSDKIEIKIDNKIYTISTQSAINFRNIAPDNVLSQLLTKYDISGDKVINNNNNEISIFIKDIAQLLDENSSFSDEKLEQYLKQIPQSDNKSLKDSFLDFIQSILPEKDQDNTNTKLTNQWVVQNNQSLSDISKMILKQINPNYTSQDVVAMNLELKALNKDKLDGTKNGFLVNSEITLPYKINISNEKFSDNPVYDYVLHTRKQWLQNIVDKYKFSNPENSTQTFNDAKMILDMFIKEYGYLKSYSMEDLLLAPQFEGSESDYIDIEKIRDATRYYFTDVSKLPLVKGLSEAVKKYKAGNCGEVSPLVQELIYKNFDDKYYVSELAFYSFNPFRDHVATILKNRLTKEEYVIDPWIDPKNGAIFKPDDWGKMLTEVFQTKDFIMGEMLIIDNKP